MQTVKKIGVLSMGIFMAIYMALFGLLSGIFSMVISAILNSMVAQLSSQFGTEIPGASVLGGVGWLTVIIFPILFGVIGFIFGTASALFYNLVAKYIGGVKMDLETEGAGAAQPQQPTQATQQQQQYAQYQQSGQYSQYQQR